MTCGPAYASTQGHMHTQTRTCTYTQRHTYAHIHTHVHTHIYTCTLTQTHTQEGEHHFSFLTLLSSSQDLPSLLASQGCPIMHASPLICPLSLLFPPIQAPSASHTSLSEERPLNNGHGPKDAFGQCGELSALDKFGNPIYFEGTKTHYYFIIFTYIHPNLTLESPTE